MSAKIAAVAISAGVSLSAKELTQFKAYFELLARWNARMNLTALPLDPPSGETLARSVVAPGAAALFFASSPLVWFDLGSGGGIPAIPIKILRPSLKLTMVESRARKAAFLREAIRYLELPDTDVRNDRFEVVADSTRNSADVVTMEAVRVDDATFAAVSQLLVPRGRVLWFGGSLESLPSEFQPAGEQPHPLAHAVALEKRFHIVS